MIMCEWDGFTWQGDTPPKIRREIPDPTKPTLSKPDKLPGVKVEESSCSLDWLRLLEDQQFVDVAFYVEAGGDVLAGHTGWSCSVSPVFLQLLGEEGEVMPGSCLPSTLRAPLSLISASDSTHRSNGCPPSRVLMKDPLLSCCLPEMLQFLYAGAYQWKELQSSVEKKLWSAQEVRELLQTVRRLLGNEENTVAYNGMIQMLSETDNHIVDSLLSPPSPQLCSNDHGPPRIPQQDPISLGRFLNSPVFSDIAFMLEGTPVPAHRAVLSVPCKLMAIMFNGKYVEASSSEFSFLGISRETFLSYLEYIYTDACCPDSLQQAMSLLVFVDMYQLTRLQHLCEACVCKYLESMPSRKLLTTSLNIVTLLRRAQRHNSQQLATWFLHFIASNFLIFKRRDDFLYLTGKKCWDGESTSSAQLRDVNGKQCIVCPWHKYKITLVEGEGLYQSIVPLDPRSKAIWCSKGVMQRTHSVQERDGDVFVTLSDLSRKVESHYYQSEKYKQAMRATIKR
ncbi:rho-related BTB domain-containing protein 3-like [Amia ocellicauda]|uniref:rho-related BTB domain-containing protein 3-like n=1 Tax=Amia ocellicauda TaxID=2972642 RepID=UPI003463ADB3